MADEQSVEDWCKRQQNRMASTFGLPMEAEHILQIVYDYERYRAALREGEK